MWKKRPITRDQVQFSFECDEDVQGCGRRRHCSTCDETVWDTSKMTRAEYLALPETACVTATFRNAEMVFAPEPARFRKSFAAIAAAGFLAMPLAGCDTGQSEQAPVASPVVAAAAAAQSPPSDVENVPASASLGDVLENIDETAEPTTELPARLTASERRLAYRLKTEFGIDVEGFEGRTRTPRPRSPRTLRGALEDLELLQAQRDWRRRDGDHQVSKTTLREALETLEVVQGRRRPMRQRRIHVKPHGTIQIIQGVSDE